MNAILLTVLALGGADSAAMFGGHHGGGGDAYCDQCDACSDGGGGHHQKGYRGGWLGNMPQSCYNPSFGCYPSTRFMHRYPAFHGNYYREAYNYRNYFDYPWHAGLHEPTSHFSYHVPGEAPAAAAPPQPVPSAASLVPPPVRAASAEVPEKSVMTVTPYKIPR
jgi:hypothetical protein